MSDNIVEKARELTGLVSSGKDVYHADVATVAAALLKAVAALEWYAYKANRNEEMDKANADGGFFPYDANDYAFADDNGKLARETLKALGVAP